MTARLLSLMRAALAAAALLGCSKDKSPAPSASSSPEPPPPPTYSIEDLPAGGPVGPPPPPCTVVSRADIAAALGRSFIPKEVWNSQWSSSCRFEPSGDASLDITTQVEDPSAWETTVKCAKGRRPVAGLGHDAYFQLRDADAGRSSALLNARLGTTFVSINVTGTSLDAEKIEAGAKVLAAKILAQVPSDASGPPAVSPDAAPPTCSVVSDADVATTLGPEFTLKRSSKPVKNATACNYESSGCEFLNILAQSTDKARWDQIVGSAKGARRVAGLGDDAYFKPRETAGRSSADLYAYKETTQVGITVTGTDVDMEKVEAGEKALMKKILAKVSTHAHGPP